MTKSSPFPKRLRAVALLIACCTGISFAGQAPQKQTPGKPAPPAVKPLSLPPTSTVALPPVTPKPPPALSLLYGVNVVWGENGGTANWDKNKGAQAKTLIALMKSAGVTNTRVEVTWGDIERARGKYDWRGLDKFLRYVKGQGFVLTCVVRGTPDWASMVDPRRREINKILGGMARWQSGIAPDPKYYPDFGKFAAELGKRYKDIVHRWEVWDEPDGRGMPVPVRDASGQNTKFHDEGDPTVYTKLLTLFSQNIKRTHPSCLVAIGGLATPRTDFLKAVYANGGQKFFDAVALHPANNASGPLAFRWVEDCRKVLEQRGDSKKRFWITAWGWNTYPDEPEGLTEGHQARLVRESLREMRRRPYIEQASYQTFNDWRGEEKEPLTLKSRGLCSRALRPRPAFFAFQSEARQRLAVTRPLRRLNLLADLPPKMQETAVNLDVETARLQRGLGKTWLGVSFPTVSELETLLPRLKAAGATMVRLNPFTTPDVLTVAPDGSTVVRWETADALLEKVATGGGQTVLALTPPTGLSVEKWRAFVTEAAGRYGKEPKFGVLRWEMAIPQRTAGETASLIANYAPAFVRAVRAALPTTPVGFHLLTPGNPVTPLHPLAHACTEASVTFDSFSWQDATPSSLASTIRSVRAELAAFPGLRGVRLLPELNHFATPASTAACVERLRDFTPSDQPNSALGFFVSARTLAASLENSLPAPRGKDEGGRMKDEKREGNSSFILHPSSFRGEGNSGGRIGNALALVNRLSGSRVETQSDESGVRCLATRSANGVTVLVWREGRAEMGDLLTKVRLRDLPPEAKRGLRIERYALSDSDSSAPKLAAVTDVSGSAGGSLEIPLLLKFGDVALLSCTVRRALPPLEITLSSPRFLWAGGESPELMVVIRNASATPQRTNIELTGSVAGLVPASLVQTKSETLPPGKSRALRYRLRAPIVMQDTEAVLNVKVGADSRASLALRVAGSLTAELETPRLDAETSGQSVTARVRLTNRGKIPLLVTLRAPGGASARSAVAGGKSQRAEVSLEAPQREPGVYEVPLTIEGDSGLLTTLPVLVGVPVACRHARMKMEIDADLSEWTDAVPLGMGREEQVRLKTWRGPNDLSALAYTAWDEQFFYVACAVEDDTPGPAHPLAELGRGDSVQFALSANRLPTDGYHAGDHEFGLALVDEKPVAYRFYGENLARGLVSGAVVAVKRVASRTFYEAAIPWKELAPIMPAPGATFGFSLLVNDDDGRGRGYIEWGGGLGDTKRPGRFPPLRLVR